VADVPAAASVEAVEHEQAQVDSHLVRGQAGALGDEPAQVRPAFVL